MEKRKRGRPKGSKNKPKITQDNTETPVRIDPKDIRRQIRALRKIKRDIPKKTEERRELNQQIRDLKNRLVPIYNETDPIKIELINKIMLKRPEYERIGVDLYKFTTEELQKHLNYIQGRPRLI